MTYCAEIALKRQITCLTLAFPNEQEKMFSKLSYLLYWELF